MLSANGRQEQTSHIRNEFRTMELMLKYVYVQRYRNVQKRITSKLDHFVIYVSTAPAVAIAHSFASILRVVQLHVRLMVYVLWFRAQLCVFFYFVSNIHRHRRRLYLPTYYTLHLFRIETSILSFHIHTCARERYDVTY